MTSTLENPVTGERFEVVRGTVRFRVGLRTLVAGPGDVVEVPPGVTHTMAERFTEVVALAQAGRMNRRGLPRNLRDLATLAHRYARATQAPLLTARLQRWLAAPLVRRAPLTAAGTRLRARAARL